MTPAIQFNHKLLLLGERNRFVFILLYPFYCLRLTFCRSSHGSVAASHFAGRPRSVRDAPAMIASISFALLSASGRPLRLQASEIFFLGGITMSRKHGWLWLQPRSGCAALALSTLAGACRAALLGRKGHQGGHLHRHLRRRRRSFFTSRRCGHETASETCSSPVCGCQFDESRGWRRGNSRAGCLKAAPVCTCTALCALWATRGHESVP